MEAHASNGTTATLVEKVLEGAASAGAETEIINLYSQTFKGCVSCFACKRKGSRTNGLFAVRDESLLGHSQGGVVVSMTAGELGDNVIKNVVLMAPAAVLRDDAIRGNTQGAQYDPGNFKGDYVKLPWGGYKLGRKYVESAVNLPIYETAWRYTGPVLVIQGTHDRIVPYTYAERYQQGYKDCTLKLIPEEDHSFTKNTAEAALYASDWLSKQLKKE